MRSPLLLSLPVLLAGHRKSIVPILRVTLVISTLASFYAIWQHFVGIDLVRDRSLMTEWGHFESVGFFGQIIAQCVPVLGAPPGFAVFCERSFGAPQCGSSYVSKFTASLATHGFTFYHVRSTLLVIIGAERFLFFQMGKNKMYCAAHSLLLVQPVAKRQKTSV